LFNGTWTVWFTYWIPIQVLGSAEDVTLSCSMLLLTDAPHNKTAKPPTTPARTPPAIGIAIPAAPAVDVAVAPPAAAVFVGEDPPVVPEPGIAVAVVSPRPEPPVRMAGQSVFRFAGSAARYDEATSVGHTKDKQVLLL